MSAKVVSRGAGRSAVAASAYLSCSRMYNDYDGIQHDYTRKHGLAYQEVLLPPMAPPEWKDREKLWNAVEQAEKTKDSRLAREFVVALLDTQYDNLSDQLTENQKLFQEIKANVSPEKSEELFDAGVDERDKIRNQVYQKLYATMGHKFNTSLFRDSIQDIDNQLDEDTEKFRGHAFQKSITKELGRRKSQSVHHKKKVYNHER